MQKEIGKNKIRNKSSAATIAKNKYRAKNYDRKELILPKGMKAEIQSIVDSSNKLYDSLNSYIVTAIKEKRERDNGMN
jgi:hypothetical protein